MKFYSFSACFKKKYSEIMANRTCTKPWTHHFTGNEMAIGENCTSEDYKGFYYEEQRMVEWILYDEKSPCKG